MQISSTRFGVMDIQQSDIIVMPRGLIGFEDSRHWVLLSNPQNTAVAWFQSIAQAHVAIPVVSPRRFDPQYRVHVAKRDLAHLHLRPNDSIYVLSVVSRNNGVLTANLKSPILMNATKQVAVQIIATDAQVIALPIGTIASSFQVKPRTKQAA
jgi:flagellar assembly factor FliW